MVNNYAAHKTLHNCIAAKLGSLIKEKKKKAEEDERERKAVEFLKRQKEKEEADRQSSLTDSGQTPQPQRVTRGNKIQRG